MRYASTRCAVLPVTLALMSAAVLAVVWPVSAFADDPVVGDTTTTTVTDPVVTTPAPEQTPDGNLITIPAPPPPKLVILPDVTGGKTYIAHIRAIKMRQLHVSIKRYRSDAAHWALIMGTSVRLIHKRRLAAMGLTTLKRKAAEWKAMARQLHRKARHPPHMADFLCIHGYEGSWTDPNPPFFGGLQMDLDFQRDYGLRFLYPKGPGGPMVTADHWTPLEQIWVAEKALRSRGFYPWPNTARSCGLL